MVKIGGQRRPSAATRQAPGQTASQVKPLAKRPVIGQITGQITGQIRDRRPSAATRQTPGQNASQVKPNHWSNDEPKVECQTDQAIGHITGRTDGPIGLDQWSIGFFDQWSNR